MKTKRIYCNYNKTKYVVVKLFKKRIDMQKAYEKRCPNDKNHEKVLGVHNAYEKWEFKNKKKTLSPETGTVFLSLEDCQASKVAHEFMHAIFWSNGHKMYKKQYPIIIKNMEKEEKMLHNLSYMLRQFYNWYWKVCKKIK